MFVCAKVSSTTGGRGGNHIKPFPTKETVDQTVLHHLFSAALGGHRAVGNHVIGLHMDGPALVSTVFDPWGELTLQVRCVRPTKETACRQSGQG